ARAYLRTLEALQAAHGDSPQGQLDFTSAEAPPDAALRAALDALDPDSMTPRDALDAIYRLK
ncbi:MAG: hypothetical protein GTO67_02370, partial [Gammaproteobacteria bacterium]|nr:hypothetical protein [Gammaproteobacteria bacterium]NIT15309.1 hypothetical protein [Gammaproteobacteria bacterium]